MSDRKRRIMGTFLGLLFGVPYSITSQYINSWMLPGIPLFELPLDRATTVILTTIAMGVLGLIVAWEEESFWGLLGGSLFIVTLGSIQAYINSASSEGVTSFFLFLFTFLPRLIIYLPLAFALRWVLNHFDRNAHISSGRKRRPFIALILLVVLAVVGGRFSLLAPEAINALKSGYALAIEGMQAAENGADLPVPLLDVDGFATFAKGPFSVEWSSDVDSLPVTRPIAKFGVTESLIIFHYENDYIFGCAYTPPNDTPKCINITRVR